MARPVSSAAKSAKRTRARRVSTRVETLPRRLQRYVDEGRADPKRGMLCCNRWQDFTLTAALSREVAQYAAAANGFDANDLQTQAIASWPPEQLAVLKQLIPLILRCPKDPKGKLILKVKFTAGIGRRRGLRIRISEPDNVLNIQFIAPAIA